MTVFRFVDDISTGATVRLDLLDVVNLAAMRNGIDLRPAPMRSIAVESMLADGAPVVATARDNMTLTIPLLIKGATDDARRAQMTAIARECDRPRNFLEVAIRDTTSSRWLHCYRSAIVDFDPHYGERMWRAVLQINADPWAYGELVTLDTVAVSTDPAAATNPMLFDVTSVQGDVATPLVLWTDGNGALTFTSLMVAVRSRGNPVNLVTVVQAEAGTAQVDTSIQAHDALMSGAGSNFLRTTFTGVAAMTPRWSVYWPLTSLTSAQQAEAPGEYRVLVRVRKSVADSEMYLRFSGSWGTSEPVLAQGEFGAPYVAWVDLGVISIGRPVDRLGLATLMAEPLQLNFEAERRSGTGTLDWDAARFVPAEESTIAATRKGGLGLTVIDGVARQSYMILSGTGGPFDAAAQIRAKQPGLPGGGWPHVTPGAMNRLYLTNVPDPDDPENTQDTLDTWDLDGGYYPRHLAV